MTRDEFDAYCQTLKATTQVVQWGNASVWKVGGKIFAICSGWGDGDGPKFSFKCSDMAFTILSDQSGIIPAPYLARAKWVQIETPEGMSDVEIRKHIEAAHNIVAGKLTKAKRAEFELG